MSGRRRLAVAVASAILASPGVSRASAFEVEGAMPEGVAEIGARAARADDGTACFYSPGGLGLGRGARAEVAAALGVSALSAQGQTRALDDPFGIALAVDATVPLEGVLRDRIRFGFAGYFLPDAALHLVTRRGAEPFFPYYDNRTQRLVAIPALSVRIAKGLAIGAGANFLAGVEGPADVRPGPSGAPESRIDEEATSVVAANLGIRWDPMERIHLAFVYRQQFAVPSAVATTAEVGGVPLVVDVGVREALFDPHTFVLGTSVEVGRASFELDASYALWSAYEGPLVSVKSSLPGLEVGSALPVGLFRDVLSVRAGASMTLPAGANELTLRGGAGFEPTILKSDRQGRTNFVDGDKLLFGIGATLALDRVLPPHSAPRGGVPSPRALRISAGANLQHVSTFEQTKVACTSVPCPPATVAGPDAAKPSEGITNPGYPKLTGGGAFWSMSLGVGVDL